MYELSPNLQGTTLSLGLIGDVTLDDVVAFNNEMREHSKTPNITQLVLNLSQVSSMDAAGLGVLVSLNTSMQRYGRRLVLLCLAPHIDKWPRLKVVPCKLGESSYIFRSVFPVRKAEYLFIGL